MQENLRLRASAEDFDASAAVLEAAEEPLLETPPPPTASPRNKKAQPPPDARKASSLPSSSSARPPETAEEIWRVALAAAGRDRGSFTARLRLEAERTGWCVEEQLQIQCYVLSKGAERRLVPFSDASPRHTIIRRFFDVRGTGDNWSLTSAATVHPGVPGGLPAPRMSDEHFQRGSIEAKE